MVVFSIPKCLITISSNISSVFNGPSLPIAHLPSFKMKFIAVASLVSLVSAASVDLNKRDSPLNVKLEVTGTTAKAVVTNTGSEDLKVFKTGSFLDDKAVEKVQVFKGGK
jgi:hypothetical protein